MSVTILGRWRVNPRGMYCMIQGIYIGSTDSYILVDVDTGAEYYSDLDAYRFAHNMHHCVRSRELSYGDLYYTLQPTRGGYICVALADGRRTDDLDWLSKIDDRQYLFEVSNGNIITRGVVRFDN